MSGIWNEIVDQKFLKYREIEGLIFLLNLFLKKGYVFVTIMKYKHGLYLF